jgi:hypothetical protein
MKIATIGMDLAKSVFVPGREGLNGKFRQKTTCLTYSIIEAEACPPLPSPFFPAQINPAVPAEK